jgi:hypothetical protein
MKKDTPSKSGVGRPSARTAPVGELTRATPAGPGRALSATGVGAQPAAVPSFNNSARYADSRLKQFCLR